MKRFAGEAIPFVSASQCCNPACGTRTARAAQQCLACGALLRGTRLGKRFRIEHLLGRGGMGAVYQATDLTLDRQVAVKVLSPTGGLVGEAPAELQQRFFREARLAAQLDHPQIVPVLHFDRDGPLAYLVMPLLTRGTLATYLAHHERSDPNTVLGWLRQLAAALDYAHLRPLPIVHRDVKPGNLLFHQDGRLCLSDFGIARVGAAMAPDPAPLTRAGVVLGSLSYLAPEQFSGQAVPASDQYSVGVILCQALTGTLPFQGEDPYALLLQHLETVPLPPSRIASDLPPAVDTVVLRALAKDPQARFPTMGALAAAFEAALAGESVKSSTVPGVSPTDLLELPRAARSQEAEDPRGELPTLAALSLRPVVPSVPTDERTSTYRPQRRTYSFPTRQHRIRMGRNLSGMLVLLLGVIALIGLSALNHPAPVQRAVASKPLRPSPTVPRDPHLAALLAAEQQPVLLQDTLSDNHLHWSLGPGAHFTRNGLQLAAIPTSASTQSSSSATQEGLQLPGNCDIEFNLTAAGGPLEYGIALLSLVPPSLVFRFGTAGTYYASWYAGSGSLGEPSQGHATGLILTSNVRVHMAILLQGNQAALFLNTGAGIRWITTLSSASLFRGAQALMFLNFGNATAGSQAEMFYSDLRIYPGG